MPKKPKLRFHSCQNERGDRLGDAAVEVGESEGDISKLYEG
jgi:hypothetical protein